MPSKKKMKSKRKKSKTTGAKRKSKPLRSKKAVKTKASNRAGKKRLMSDVQRAGAPRRRQRPVSAQQSGDLQGLSRAEQADSESVSELVEQGDLFEAGAVAGVEEADNADEREVQTHEVSEDDVPEEYLDKE